MASSNAERQRAHRERTKAKLTAAPVVVEREVVVERVVSTGPDTTDLRSLVERLYGERKLNMLGRRALLDWIEANG